MSNYKYGFVRVASVVPPLKVGEISYNTQEIIKKSKEATTYGASLVVFPELSLTGYTIADLFHQELVWKKISTGLENLEKNLPTSPSVIVVGAPQIIDGKIFNCAIAFYKGKVTAIIPKTYIPGYKEFYEKRWFSSAHQLSSKSVEFNGRKIPVGTDILLKTDDGKVIFGVEICEDLWGPLPPSSFQAVAGANIIANISASNELVGKSTYRRDLVVNQSARAVCGYVYTSCGINESSTDLVFSGHSIIAENGVVLKENELFEKNGTMIFADVDIAHCAEDRVRMTSFADSQNEIKEKPFRFVELSGFASKDSKTIERIVRMHPFIPKNENRKHQVAEELFSIQVAGLITRLSHTGIKDALIGLSGGLDSTLALLVTVQAFQKLKIPTKRIHAFTMPGFGTTKTTKNNAHILAKSAGVTIEEIDIIKGSQQLFKEIHHNETVENSTFDNVQARYRTMILMNKANQCKGIVIGTGDLSEIALGWSTFNGDHISHYNVNCGVPKTLIRHVVEWVKLTTTNKTLASTLHSVLSTPISPELKRHKKGKITQKTENIIGPYELHDFFLYHFVRWGSEPKKILFLATHAFKDVYTQKEIKKWLTVFIKRFFGNQWKRSVASDGPKVGSVSLSPRGDWRMPSDANPDTWLEELN